MKKLVAAESASDLIDARINELADWRGKALARVRAIIHRAAALNLQGKSKPSRTGK